MLPKYWVLVKRMNSSKDYEIYIMVFFKMALERDGRGL
jgi:hypothetical protein